IDVWPPDRARAQELAKVLKLGKLAPGEWAEIYVNQLPYFGFDVDRYKRYYFPETDVSMFVEAIDGRLYAKMLRFHPPRLIAWHRGMVASNTYEPPREWTQSHGIFGVIPGRTTREQLLANRLWGKPLAEKRTPNGETRMEFRVDGWSRVTAVVQGGVVRTIDARPMPENSATDAIWRSMKLGTLELVSDRTALPIEALIGPELPAGRKLYRPSQAEGVLLLESASPGSSRTEVVRFFSPLSKQRVAVGFREAIPGSTLADELTAIPTWKKPTRRKQEGEVERWEYESDLFLPWRRVTLTIRNGRVATIDLIPAFQVTPERLSGSLGPLVSRFGLPGKQAFAAEGPAVPSSWHPAESLTYLIVVFSEGETSAKGSVRSVRLYGVRTAFLGTSTRSLTEQEINTLPVDSGLRVLAVWPQSAAAQARIESGDVFVTFDGHPLGSGLDLFRLVQPAPIGSNHDIEVLRRDDRLTVTVTLQPQTPSARYYQAAATSARAGRFELAEVLSGKALELHPKAPMVLLLRAACRRELSDYSNALADVDRLLALDPNSEPAYIERAKINTKLNKLDAALADANAAIRLTGASTPYATRAFVLMTQGRLDEALVDANRAVAKDAKSAFALLCRGKIHRRRNDLESALKDLEQACKLDPIDFDANVWRGGMLFDL
ncbi:MAG TPA: tetratricopeptide repeat protein, partial [Planctomycetaceae bacterium]|nr:tetratricopeptide repeat protein [Planctomycetaceae bacterium]